MNLLCEENTKVIEIKDEYDPKYDLVGFDALYYATTTDMLQKAYELENEISFQIPLFSLFI